MCGIAGIYAFNDNDNAIDSDELTRIRDHMHSRGPDGKGMWLDNQMRVGLAHRRLSIIDLSNNASQPMISADGRYVITFNGEIYNFQSLRRELEKNGYHFKSTSDTEVLLNLYNKKGAGMVHDLRGMFAFAIWDTQRNRLFLARDPYGIKPLYYSIKNSVFRFASQVKALLAGGAISTEHEAAGMVGFYLFGSVPEPFTCWRDIRALPAGSTMYIDKNGARDPDHYFSIAKTYRLSREKENSGYKAEELQDITRTSLLDSIRHHLVSDVPVGAFLSAGIDSGALVGLMRDAGQGDIQTITLAFEEYKGQHSDETFHAEKIAKLYSTKHSTHVISKDDFQKDLPLIIEAMDQPSIDGINTWFVSKAASEAGLKVAISGLGGDELFGGYSLFRTIPQLVRLMRLPGGIPYLGQWVRRAAIAIGIESFGINPKSAGLIEYAGSYPGAWLLRRGLFMPWELEQLLGPEIAREGLARLNPVQYVANVLDSSSTSAFVKIATLESSLYMRNQLLRDCDWASMAHSLEVRVPLVDTTLLKCIAPLNAKQSLITKEMLGLSPLSPLPDDVMHRQKTGFSIPIQQWTTLPNKTGGGAARKKMPWACKWAKIVAKNIDSQVEPKSAS